MKSKWITGGLVLILVVGVWGGLEAFKSAQQKPSVANANEVISANSSAGSSTNPSSSSQANGATSSDPKSGAGTAPLIDDQGGIQVGVLWDKANPGSKDQTFLIEFNNHEVDVEEFDYANIQVKLNDKEIPVQVKNLKKNGAGHHASAEVTLESTDFVNLKKGSTLTLVIKNVFNTPTRTFSWAY